MKKIRLNHTKPKVESNENITICSVLSCFNTNNNCNDNNNLLAIGFISSRGIYPMRASSHESFAENLRVVSFPL